MISLTCPSCSTKLRMTEDLLSRGRSRAKCPKCQGSVPLPSPGEQAPSPSQAGNITVECASCHCRLKAPASRRGSKARCPKCKEEVMIVPAGGSAVLPGVAWAAGGTEESSGAATRRIDSRALGLFSAGPDATPATSGDMDLDNVIRSGRELDKPTPLQAAPVAPPAGADAGIVPSLMNPPTPQLKQIAGEIRDAATHLGMAPAKEREAARTPPPPHAPSVAVSRPAHVPGRAPAAQMTRPPRAFPLTRGLAAGSLSGLLIGGTAAAVWSAVGEPALGWTLAPIPWRAEALGLPDVALRIAIPALLGSLCGAVAAGAGSPTVEDRPLSLMRCGFSGMLAGAAAGLVASLAAGDSFQIWPLLNWMRDLALVGLLTPAVNRMVPSRRT